MGRKANEKVGSSYCHGLGGNQVFAYTKRQQIMSDDNCLDSASPRGPVNLVRCHGMLGNQEWKYDTEVREGFWGRLVYSGMMMMDGWFFVSSSGAHDKTRQLRQLFESRHRRGSVRAAAAAVRLFARPAVADEVAVQVAGQQLRRRSRCRSRRCQQTRENTDENSPHRPSPTRETKRQESSGPSASGKILSVL